MPSHAPNGTTRGASVNGHGNGLLGHVRFVPLSFDPSRFDASARELVLALRPEWSSPDSDIQLVRFTDGITNTLLKAVNRRPAMSTEDVDREAILLRAYGNGTDVLIDRRRETQNHELLMKFGLAPELLARFQNGIAYRYISGRPTSPADLREPSVYCSVARRLAQWHARMPCIYEADDKPNRVNGAANGSINRVHKPASQATPGKPSPNVWTVMQKWIAALPTATEDERCRQKTLQVELGRLIGELSQRPGLGKDGLVFAHCDLLSGNVIIEMNHRSAKSNSVGDQQVSVKFIDYEYATPSPAAFDIANHFAEWGGFDCDYNVLPTRTQRREFIQQYIGAYFDAIDHKPDGVDQEVEAARLMEEVDTFRGVPGFYWGIWALIQATISTINFDYASYAEIRLGEYWSWRAEVDGSRAQKGDVAPLRERRWAQER